mgnify:CR=1 FL=1
MAKYNIIDIFRDEGLVKNPGFHSFVLKSLFGNIYFNNKTVVDVGSGNGKYSFFAANSGAKKVYSLEPEADGSGYGNMMEKYTNVMEKYDLNNVELRKETLSSFIQNKLGILNVDIVMLINSINHIDEDSVELVHKDRNSLINYLLIFKEIYDFVPAGCEIIITDSPRDNFLANLGLINPIYSMIEWEKHQSPRIWEKLLLKSGFTNIELFWLLPGPMRHSDTLAYLFGCPFVIYCNK